MAHPCPAIAMRLLAYGGLALIVTLFGACAMPAQRKAAEAAEIRTQAAQEVHRICALPEPERAAEIERVKTESGVAVVCPRH